jgi:hypothetical protein
MQTDKVERPEIKLLNSIIDDELKDEHDEKLKELVKSKATVLYPLISLIETQDLDEDEIKKKIKALIEER